MHAELDSDSTAAISQAITAHASEFYKPGVLSVRAGYEMHGGWVTKKPAIVVTVDQKSDTVAPADRLPDSVGGFAVDVRQASPLKRLQVSDSEAFANVAASTPTAMRLPVFPDELKVTGKMLAPLVTAASAPATPQIPYQAPAGTPLVEIDETVTLLCHASPDAGWPTLKDFISKTKTELTVGLYDFTSAHILTFVTATLASKNLNLVLDDPIRNPTADQSDPETVDRLRKALKDSLTFAWALDNRDPFASAWIVPSAYHIKVAVRDHEAVWLSSGNWNNSNQPDIDPVTNPVDARKARNGDRDWHVVVESPTLAAVFDAYLANDLQVAGQHQAPPPGAVAAHAARPPAVPGLPRGGTPPFAKFFAPAKFHRKIKLRPVLTPDAGVYTTAVLAMIKSATKSLLIQLQYIHASTKPGDGAFVELVSAVADRQRAGIDVRIIMSEFETGAFLEQLQTAGVDLSAVRIQNNVHNKGIIVDSSTVLVSSQNWSGDGVLRNRDAGLIISDAAAAQYFETIFEHDWANLAQQRAHD